MKNSSKLICAGALSCLLTLSSCAGTVSANNFPSPDSMMSSQPSALSIPVIPGFNAFNRTLPQLKTYTGITTVMPLAQVTPQKTISVDLSIPQKFGITRPSEKLTTTYAKYFITGTSNPKQPVYFGKKEIERIGTMGTFGVLVDLAVGTNTFTFSQGGKSETVTIVRKAYIASQYIPISNINQASMVPAEFSGVKVGDALTLGCIAPAGAAVTATFDGQTISLKPASTTTKEGLPVSYKAAMTIKGNYDDDVTQKAGKVTYTLKYKGKTTEHTSTGNVYVAGKNSNIAVRVKSYVGFVYPNKSNLSVFREKLKRGAVAYILSQDNTYAELNSGGHVPKERLQIIEGNVRVKNKFSGVKAAVKGRVETYTFAGTTSPAYYTRLADGKFSITFYNTTGAPKPKVDSSKLFSGVSVSEGESSVTYTFTQKNSAFWGYDVNYNGKNTILTFKIKPSVSSGSNPLSGVTVVLDPGHGGTDNGAMGVVGDTGPNETDVNLAHAYATRDALEAMGAKVYLTRSTDVFYDLDDRLAYSENAGADIFVSIHHNSIGENVDANTIKGVEVYYHTALSKKLANTMFSTVTSQAGRNPRFVSQSYYRVTLSPYSPSILLELGYLSNPLEYERATSSAQIKKAAQAIADGIKKSLE